MYFCIVIDVRYRTHYFKVWTKTQKKKLILNLNRLMKHLFLSVIAVLMSAFMVSCSDDDSVASQLSSDKTEVTYSSDRAVESVLVTATANWNVVTDVEWIHLTKTSYEAAENNIAFILDANLTCDDRVGHILVTSGDKQLTFTITQEGTVVVKLSQDTYNVPGTGGVLNVNIAANVALDVDIETGDDWLDFVEFKGAGTAFPVLLFSAAENTTEYERSAVVIIKDVNSDVSQTLSIVQKEKQTFEVTDGTIREVAGNEPTAVSFNIRQNIDYVEFISDNSWIKPHEILPVATKGQESNSIVDKTIYYDIMVNDSYDEREGTIMLTNAANGESLALMTIKQDGNPILELTATSLPKDKEKYSADAARKSYNVKIKTNAKQIIANSSAEWIGCVESVDGFTLNVTQNTTEGTREATVTISDVNGKAAPIVMTITQKKP